jgi:hypothetical protein
VNGPCPKCGHLQVEPAESCRQCGVIFSRIRLLEQQTVAGSRKDGRAAGDNPSVLLAVKNGESLFLILVKATLLMGLAIWGLRLASQPIVNNAAGESVLHLINLPFHEAGHVLFTPFGRFIQILGGTLGQLIIPALVVGTFIRQQQPYSASIGLWWLGESFLDIAPYINDARAGQLMLLGGVTGSEVEDYHDWEGILGRLGMMQYDHALARLAVTTGVILILTAVSWGGWILWREYSLREQRTS